MLESKSNTISPSNHHQVQVYQGDALSLLLFCIVLNPLSQIITNISHLLYMDNIKLYVKREQNINSLIYLNRIYSKDSENSG